MSGFVPGFENDLFISYAHADGQAWIQAFEKSLCEELSRRLGVRISVWQDTNRLRVGQNWKAEIEAGVQRSAVFIAMLSPSYENSEWCASERGVFQQLFSAQDDFENSKRFFKVVKTPWDNESHLYFLSAVENLDFFRREESLSDDVEFEPGSVQRPLRRAVDPPGCACQRHPVPRGRGGQPGPGRSRLGATAGGTAARIR